MAMEVELKLRVDSHDLVRARLEAFGARFLGRVTETNYILDDLAGGLRGGGCGLRVRVARDRDADHRSTTLTFKGPRVPGVVKSREELETGVESAEVLLEVLSRLGFVSILQYEKRRESWSLDGCRVELDTPPALGLFVEIEGDNEEMIEGLRRKLELSGARAESSSYVSMLLAHCQRAGPADRVLRLPPE